MLQYYLVEQSSKLAPGSDGGPSHLYVMPHHMMACPCAPDGHDVESRGGNYLSSESVQLDASYRDLGTDMMLKVGVETI